MFTAADGIRGAQDAGDQHDGGGNHYSFDFEKGLMLYGWRPMETSPEPLA